MHNANWDDLRYVLAVAETGSLSAAARQMGVNHATVLRHVHAFEAAHGGPVFDRTPQGYAVLDSPTMPIVGEGDAEPNDTYVEQLVASAEAAVEEVVKRGVTGPSLARRPREFIL